MLQKSTLTYLYRGYMEQRKCTFSFVDRINESKFSFNLFLLPKNKKKTLTTNKLKMKPELCSTLVGQEKKTLRRESEQNVCSLLTSVRYFHWLLCLHTFIGFNKDTTKCQWYSRKPIHLSSIFLRRWLIRILSMKFLRHQHRLIFEVRIWRNINKK